ncbi:hypothetical protein [Seonamhaeicola maritimus]|uniref:hypothetical protein n=1 Tax=Seonamhaeicola maritimus TaxID=2591822 RepID=UPI0024954C3A|nr:hypothetical protein [Seonamhaeicola maritimus]
MKNIIYKIGILQVVLILAMVSCTSPEGETNYTPATYEFPGLISLSPGNTDNSSFEFTYNVSGSGKGYYVVLEGGSPAPSNQDVFSGTGSGLITAGNFDLTGESIAVTVDNDLCDGTSYDIYAVQFSSDSFLSESTTSLTISTAANASIAGVYDTVTNGTLSGNFGGGPLVDYTSVVTITDNGDGTYSFSDASAGIYGDPNFYGAFGHPPLPHTFNVPCNEISDVFPTLFNACCGDAIAFDGVINSDGTISVHWESAFGEIMDVVYTKQ